ncbi:MULTISPECIES: insulinase family protein [unclassified Crossiella]|uniref:M16 family metallopeptidase n=1 Tax=unclassified Crossiella TaxID=2620835 RepID=UPI001FFE8885|nr:MULTISPECIES: insulinase family protein [unclassified Crossiella]MCK2241645.1 insulinase family protein [Crossiella sp. S99.2]MCK2255483.1 insulinase family protein [Crossiella sp. S99.1]
MTLLRNGLTVLLDPAARPGLTAVALTVAAGSGADPPGRHGLAHVVEHLMFQRESDFAARVEGWGGSSNATTHRDLTLFHTVVPDEALPGLLALEAQRLHGLGADGLAAELPVVGEEIRGILDRTRGGFPWRPLSRALLSRSEWLDPYGEPAEVAAVTAADCEAFISTHYRPDNFTLTISGSFDADRVRALVAAEFADLPTRNPATPTTSAASAPAASTLAPDQLAIGYVLPADPAEYLATVLLAAILSGSRIPALVRSGGPVLAATFETGYQGRFQEHRAPDLAASRIRRRPGATAAEAVAAIEAEVRRIAVSGPGTAEYQRAVNRLLLNHHQEQDHVLSRVQHLARRQVLGTAPLPASLAGLSPDAVRAAAAALGGHGRTVLSGEEGPS